MTECERKRIPDLDSREAKGTTTMLFSSVYHNTICSLKKLFNLLCVLILNSTLVCTLSTIRSDCNCKTRWLFKPARRSQTR